MLAKCLVPMIQLTRTSYQYYSKYKQYYHIPYFDNFKRTPEHRTNRKNHTDPLFYDKRHEHLNGGVQAVCTITSILTT